MNDFSRTTNQTRKSNQSASIESVFLFILTDLVLVISNVSYAICCHMSMLHNHRPYTLLYCEVLRRCQMKRRRRCLCLPSKLLSRSLPILRETLFVAPTSRNTLLSWFLHLILLPSTISTMSQSRCGPFSWSSLEFVCYQVSASWFQFRSLWAKSLLV